MSSGGHQRLAVLREEGHQAVEVVVVSLEEAREKALNVALNNSQVGGDWDAGKLLDLMEELHELPDFDETLTGFDADDVRDLLLLPEANLEPEVEEEGQDVVRVALEVAPESWADVRPLVDELVKEFGLRAHVFECGVRVNMGKSLVVCTGGRAASGTLKVWDEGASIEGFGGV